MASQHHGHDEEQTKLMQDYINEMHGKMKRRFPDSRVGPDDDGATTYAIASDPRHGIIRIQFTKPIVWLGLDRESAEQLRDSLDEKILELRGISSNT